MVTSRATNLCHRTEKTHVDVGTRIVEFHGEMMKEKARNSRSWCGCCFFFAEWHLGNGTGHQGTPTRPGVWTLEKVSIHFFIMLPVVDGIRAPRERTGRCLWDLGSVRELVWCGFRVGISASRWTGVNQKRGRTSACGPDPHHSAGKVCVCGWRWGGGSYRLCSLGIRFKN